MESNDDSKEIDTKNSLCYYFHFDNILVNKRSYESILVFDNSYKTSLAKIIITWQPKGLPNKQTRPLLQGIMVFLQN